jgi:glycosyltransferase involved in cell wall biosynthesis
MQIIIIGSYPPPYGGVSKHLQRLKLYLEQSDLDCEFFDTSKNLIEAKIATKSITMAYNKWMYCNLLYHKKAILHFHHFHLRYFLIDYFVLSLRHRIIITFHNELFVETLRSKGKWAFLLFSFILNRMHSIVVVNNRCAEMARRIIKHPCKVVVIPAFIPPHRVPPITNDAILKLRKMHKYLLCSNAWQISFYNNEDLYGIDLLIEALHEICIIKGLDAAIAFSLPSIGDAQYFRQLKARIDQYRLSDRFLLITEPLEEAASLWSISDLVIRATNTDGNSLSILEALSIGIPVLASDCVERPKEVVLFKTRDTQDLVKNIFHILNNLEIYKQNVRAVSVENNAQKMLALYKSVQDADVRVSDHF